MIARAILTFSLSLALTTSMGHAAEPTTVRLAHFPNLTHASALVGVARGTFEDALAPARLDVKTFAAGPQLIEALFAGEVDIGYVGPNPAINGYVKSRGEALRVVAGASSGGALFVVRPDAKIASAADLAGKKLATPQLGGTQDVALRFYLQEHQLQTADKGGTVQIVPTQPADILTLFKEKQIDGAWLPEPWALRLVLEGGGKVFLDERQLWPDGKFVTTVVVARKAFLDEHPDLVKKFLEAHVASTQFIAAHPQEAKQLINGEIARITGKAIPPAVLGAALDATDITFDPLASSLAKQADQAYALGFLGAAKPDLGDLYATTLLDEVVKAQKPVREATR